MGTQERKRLNKILRMLIVCVMTVCLAAGAAAAGDPVYGADIKGKSPFANTGTTYYHNERFRDSLVVNGVDISDWQSKKCDFAKAKKAGVDFVIMKVTGTYYGRKKLTCYNDSNFSFQYENAKANGVMTGVYVFSQARNATEGRKEAKYAVKRLKALGIGPEDLQLPVYMDYEFAGGMFGRMFGLSRKNATAAAVAFCNAIKDAGYTPGIYANASFFSAYIDTGVLAPDVDIWCAQYYKRCQSGTEYTKWQYSSSARINGLLHYLGYKWNIDANFWYINMTLNQDPLTNIYGRTTLSLSDAKNPSFSIYDGEKLLREGTDYITGGIRNNRKGSAYIYIKGIGEYGGYALIPVMVADTTAGSDKTPLNTTAANYITKASAARSGGEITPEPEARYKKGKKYTVRTALNIRKGPGTNYGRVKRKKLSSGMKKKCSSGTYAVLKKGKKVKCTGVSGNWMKISGGWICCREGSSVYVK